MDIQKRDTHLKVCFHNNTSFYKYEELKKRLIIAFYKGKHLPSHLTNVLSKEDETVFKKQIKSQLWVFLSVYIRALVILIIIDIWELETVRTIHWQMFILPQEDSLWISFLKKTHSEWHCDFGSNFQLSVKLKQGLAGEN